MAPLFDYKCDECGHVFEDIQSYDTTEIPCPECQKTARKQMARVQKPLQGLTLADGRIRDKMKRVPRVQSAFFDRGDPRQRF